MPGTRKVRRLADAAPVTHIAHAILVLRRQRVILDRDLAALYGVTTKALNQAVKRNAERFPEDFMSRLERPEVEALNRSQSVTGSQKHRDPRFPPFAFTEHGAIMAATVLNSPRAVEMSLYVVRAFVQLRELLRDFKNEIVYLPQIEPNAVVRTLGMICGCLGSAIDLQHRPGVPQTAGVQERGWKTIPVAGIVWVRQGRSKSSSARTSRGGRRARSCPRAPCAKL